MNMENIQYWYLSQLYAKLYSNWMSLYKYTRHFTGVTVTYASSCVMYNLLCSWRIAILNWS